MGSQVCGSSLEGGAWGCPLPVFLSKYLSSHSSSSGPLWGLWTVRQTSPQAARTYQTRGQQTRANEPNLGLGNCSFSRSPRAKNGFYIFRELEKKKSMRQRLYVACRVENVYCLALHRKKLPVPVPSYSHLPDQDFLRRVLRIIDLRDLKTNGKGFCGQMGEPEVYVFFNRGWPGTLKIPVRTLSVWNGCCVPHAPLSTLHT